MIIQSGSLQIRVFGLTIVHIATGRNVLASTPLEIEIKGKHLRSYVYSGSEFDSRASYSLHIENLALTRLFLSLVNESLSADLTIHCGLKWKEQSTKVLLIVSTLCLSVNHFP